MRQAGWSVELVQGTGDEKPTARTQVVATHTVTSTLATIVADARRGAVPECGRRPEYRIADACEPGLPRTDHERVSVRLLARTWLARWPVTQLRDVTPHSTVRNPAADVRGRAREAPDLADDVAQPHLAALVRLALARTLSIRLLLAGLLDRKSVV